jgi:acid phosphatase (class A)
MMFGRKPADPRPEHFDPTQWGVDFLSQVYLVEFLANVGPLHSLKPRQEIAQIPKIGTPEESREFELLVALAENDRQLFMPHIVAQDTCFPEYFVRLLNITERTHPNTFLVLKIAARVGETAMVCLKKEYNRPRPSEILPFLFPPIQFHHPSYPSGHSLVAHLMAHCAGAVRPDMRDLLVRLADQIGRNREIAGLHFPSDTAAGIDFAEQLFELVQGVPKVNGVLDDARAEWK